MRGPLGRQFHAGARTKMAESIVGAVLVAAIVALGVGLGLPASSWRRGLIRFGAFVLIAYSIFAAIWIPAEIMHAAP